MGSSQRRRPNTIRPPIRHRFFAMAALGVGWVTLISMLVDPQHPDLSADSTQEMANARTEAVELAGSALEPPVCDPRGLASPAPNLDPSFDYSARSDGDHDPTATAARVCPTLGDLFASMATDVESEAFVGNALSRLEERLWSHDAEVQKDALEILANAARLGDEQALATLHNTLDANDHDLRRRAVRALAKTETRGFTADLVNLANDPNAGVRAQVARALGELPAELSGDLLVSMLHDPSDKVVEKALEGLGDLRYAPAHMEIAALIGARDADVTTAAGRAMRRIGDPVETVHALSFVVDGLTDSDPEVRLASLKQVRDIGGVEAFPYFESAALDADPTVRANAQAILDRLAAEQ